MMTTDTQQTYPGLVYDPAAQAYKLLGSGYYVKTPPPRARYRFIAGDKPFHIEQQAFLPGDLLGVGTVDLRWDGPTNLFEFEQVGDWKISAGIGAGHIKPRLMTGALIAIAQDEPWEERAKALRDKWDARNVKPKRVPRAKKVAEAKE